MEQLDSIIYKAINGYFALLSNMGYVRQDEIDRLIILSFLGDMKDTFYNYLTDDDYTIICKAVDCLSKSCLISPIQYTAQSSLLNESDYYKQGVFRISEESILRSTESDNTRVMD